MSLRSNLLGCASISVLLLGVACSAEDPRSAPAQPTPTEDPSAIVTDVVVRYDAEGNATLTEVPITLGERRAQEAARAARDRGEPSVGTAERSAAITQDAYCLGESFWAYDQVNLNGTRLCLSETQFYGSANLSSFCRTWGWSCGISGSCTKICTSTWDQNIRSYWSGYKKAYLTASPNGFGGSPEIPPYTNAPSIPFAPHLILLQCPATGGSGGSGGSAGGGSAGGAGGPPCPG